jgi:hypothetical protein
MMLKKVMKTVGNQGLRCDVRARVEVSARQGKARQDKARQGKARQDKTRQDVNYLNSRV